MARNVIKKYLPDPASLKEHKYLSLLGTRLYDPGLWHLHRRSASLAAFFGLFCAFLPIPLQMVIAAIIAIAVRCNLPLTICLVWITNPVTIPPIFYGTYKIGVWMLNYPETIEFQLSMEWLQSQIPNIWVPLVTGSLTCGLISGILGYLFIRLFWRWHVVKRWEKRKTLRSS